MLAPGFLALDERERKILHLRFFAGLTQSQIAKEVGISQMHVSRLIRRALEQMREGIEKPERDRGGAMSEPCAGSLLRLKVPAKPEYLVLGRLVLTGLSRSQPIDADTLSDLKLALTEACSNSIRHAYGREGGFVEISFELGDDFLAVEVVDDGPGLRAGGGR